MRILTWNIGSTFSIQYAKYFGVVYRGQKITHQYFQPVLNGEFVSNEIKKVNPEVLFLQEIHSPEDLQTITVLKEYPYQKLFQTQDLQYLDHQMLIASKRPFSEDRRGNTSIFQIGELKFVPMHLDAFSPSRRLEEMERLVTLCQNLREAIVLGDTNLWQRKGWFMWNNDEKAYSQLTTFLKDVSSNIPATSVTGFSPDKIFVSHDVTVTYVDSPKVRGHLMDHYPVIFDVVDSAL